MGFYKKNNLIIVISFVIIVSLGKNNAKAWC